MTIHVRNVVYWGCYRITLGAFGLELHLISHLNCVLFLPPPSFQRPASHIAVTGNIGVCRCAQLLTWTLVTLTLVLTQTISKHFVTLKHPQALTITRVFEFLCVQGVCI